MENKAAGNLAIYVTVIVVSICGLIYELLVGTISAMLLGEGVTQFSYVVGWYLFSMGIGAYLSKFVQSRVEYHLVGIQILAGIIGGMLPTVLFLSFSHTRHFSSLLYFGLLLTGALFGLEIPLFMRILKARTTLSQLVSKVLGLDYLGALIASVSFPFFLLPKVGIVRTGFLIGTANVLCGLYGCYLFLRSHKEFTQMKLFAVAASAILLAGALAGPYFTKTYQSDLYVDEIVFAKDTPFQKLVVTQRQDEVRLFINGHLQFSSKDEHRYHEALVHPGLASVAHPKNVLVLGGGDGLAVREILRYSAVEHITLVDIDPEMTALFKDKPEFAALNSSALQSPKVSLEHADAFLWVRDAAKKEMKYDFIVVDFPDPNSFPLGKLYSSYFYRNLAKILAPEGIAAVQSTSPLFARKSFWCIENTLSSVGLSTNPYHVYVPSFSEWGFVMASHRKFAPYEGEFPAGLRFLNKETLPTLFVFSADMARLDTEPNKLNTQVLVHYYDEEWRRLAPDAR